MSAAENSPEVAVAETGGLTSAAPVDVEVLRDEIQKTYTKVSTRPEEEFIFPTGRSWAEELDYPRALLDRVPEQSVEGFAGVANHFKLGQIEPGERVLDLGCGAGTDLLIAAQMTGPSGEAIGIDMTRAMVDRAEESAAEMGLANVEVHEGMIERIPVADESVDVVISNGVIDLIPDKDAVFSEIWRVLRGNGRLQIADVTIRRPVSEEGRRNIDLWTG
ncbi:MAG: methyltransferase domain-containing protein [Actinobacteria bacterium]|nr:methyltransferase domain-containing protein [Actinomycetota bacterium]